MTASRRKPKPGSGSSTSDGLTADAACIFREAAWERLGSIRRRVDQLGAGFEQLEAGEADLAAELDGALSELRGMSPNGDATTPLRLVKGGDDA